MRQDAAEEAYSPIHQWRLLKVLEKLVALLNGKNNTYQHYDCLKGRSPHCTQQNSRKTGFLRGS